MKKDYTIGLDIGTNSVGWAVIDDAFNVLDVNKKVKVIKNGKTRGKKRPTKMWGVRLFEEGKVAKDRRIARTTRRRIERKDARSGYLRDIFAEQIHAVDPNFFIRMDESFLKGDDRSNEIKSQFPLFPTSMEEKNYHQKFPTVYHLRKELSQNNESVDIRYIFLALNHIFKSRGHFLNEDDGDDFFGDFSNIEIKPAFEKFIVKYKELFEDSDIDISGYSDEIEKALKSHRDDSAKFIGKTFENEKTGTLYQFIKLMFGLKANFKLTFELDEDIKLQFSDEKYEEELEKLLNLISSEFAELFEHAREVSNAISLADILTITREEYKNSTTKLSASMVERYEDHKEDLKKLKGLLKSNPEIYDDYFYDHKTVKENNQTVIKANYVGYVGIPKSSYRKFLAKSGKEKIASDEIRKPYEQKYATQERFYKYTKSVLEKLNIVSESDKKIKEYLLQKIENGTFLRKQRTFDNGGIPYQLQLHELKTIIRHQKKVNPSFKEFIEGEFKEDSSITNEDAIYKIFKFRIPYYVGPLRDYAHKNDTKQKSPWLVKKTADPIRPWNFDDVVNTEQSAVKFIERMQNDCTYLYGNKTLPKASLTYQKYTVLNELAKVRLDGNLISPEIRKQIFDGLFKKQKKVSKGSFKNHLNKVLQLNVSEISGLSENSDNENQFNNQFSTYQDLRTWYIDALSSKNTSKEEKEKLKNEAEKILDDEKYLETFEEIIKVLTLIHQSITGLYETRIKL